MHNAYAYVCTNLVSKRVRTLSLAVWDCHTVNREPTIAITSLVDLQPNLCHVVGRPFESDGSNPRVDE
jgi:hypothetical protein